MAAQRPNNNFMLAVVEEQKESLQERHSLMEDAEAELLETISKMNKIIREVEFYADSIENLRKKLVKSSDGNFDKNNSIDFMIDRFSIFIKYLRRTRL